MRNSTLHFLEIMGLATAALSIWIVLHGHSPAEKPESEMESDLPGHHSKPRSLPREAFRSVGPRQSSLTPSSKTVDSAANEAKPFSPDEEVFSGFQHWLEEYKAAVSPGEAEALEKKGESLALARRSLLEKLIQSDPKHALDLALPFESRVALPETIVQHLEKLVNGVGRMDVFASVPVPGQRNPTPPIERVVTMNNQIYKAFVYGRREAQTTKEQIPLHGIAAGSLLAVSESPVRLLAAAESADPSLPAPSNSGRCPISNAQPGNPVIAQVGNEVFHLCHIEHVKEFSDALEPQENRPLGRQSDSGLNSSTQGAKTVLFMRVNFSDDPEESISESDARDILAQANDFFIQNSYGTMSLASTITPLLTLPKPRSWYAANDETTITLSALLNDARGVAGAMGFPVAGFDLDCIHLNPGVISGPRAYVGSKGAWLLGKDPATICHEFGHNLGLRHANAWKTTDGSTLGPGKNAEYGNVFDIMGYGTKLTAQYNAYNKHLLNWLPDDSTQVIASDGVYRLYPFNVPSLVSGLTYALRIPKDAQRDYWIELRNDINGLIVNWSPWGDSLGGTQLLNTTPGTQGGFYDARLTGGHSLYDQALGLKIIPLPNSDSAAEFVDVMVKHVHYLPVEAETGTLSGTTAAIDDAGASQGRSVFLPAGIQSSVTFNVSIPADGNYMVWCRARATGNGLARLAPTADDQPQADAFLAAATNWVCGRLLESQASAVPKGFQLTAGTHTLRLSGLDQNLWIDWLMVTDDPTTNIPPVASTPSTQSIIAGTTAAIPFHLTDVAPVQRNGRDDILSVTATSSNPSLIQSLSLVLGADTNNPTIVAAAASNQVGSVSITVTVIKLDGSSSTSTFPIRIVGMIQSLIDSTPAGGTAVIPAGRFVDSLVIDKDLTLQGAGAAQTVIDGNKVNIPLTVTNGAHVAVHDLTLANGRSGLRNSGVATLVRCAVRDNVNSQSGGAIWNASGASLLLDSCTVSGNRSSGWGGGIYNLGEISVLNSTVSGNRALGKASDDDTGGGGGIYNGNSLILQSCTVTQNRALQGGGIVNVGVVSIASSIIAANMADHQIAPDYKGNLQSAGYNLIQNLDGCSLDGDQTGNIYGQDPLLGTLQDNGGATLTHALLPGSPAIDAGNSGGFPLDQRGLPRTIDLSDAPNASDSSDIGAFEYASEDNNGATETSSLDQVHLSPHRESDGSMTLTVAGVGGYSWLVQASSDLGSWETITLLNGVSSNTQYVDRDAMNHEQRFYRAVRY